MEAARWARLFTMMRGIGMDMGGAKAKAKAR
jgi:hypothetical protein